MNMHVMAPIAQTGYGYVSINIIKSLVKNNHNLSLTPIGGSIGAESQEEFDMFKDCYGKLPDYDESVLKIWHQFDLLQTVGRGKYFALPFFEVDTFNKREQYHLNFPDELIVSCQWAKQVIENNNITKPVNVVPMGVDTTIFRPRPKDDLSDKYVFATVGKWEKRKSHDTIIECFNKAFSADDNVELWLLTQNPFLNEEAEKFWLDKITDSPLRDKIQIYQRLDTHESVAEFMSQTDCGIYLSRGEGWNMELLEAMAMNKPVIASNFSAHTEYCNSDNSMLVDIDELEEANDGKWFFGGSKWAKIGQNQIDQTIDHMRRCYKERIKTNESGLNTARSLTWSNTSEQIAKIMAG